MRTAEPVPLPARLALVDDHAIVRAGYARLIELEPDLLVAAEFGDAPQALAALAGPLRGRIDVLVLDLSMPGGSGLDLLRSIVRAGLPLQVLVVSMHDSAALVHQCLQAGARGFVSKSADPQALIDALRRVVRGEPVMAAGHAAARPPAPHHLLTEREMEVLRRLLTGAPFEEIAQRLGVSEKTIANHQTQIRQKLGVATAIELVHYARQHGLMP
jgi:DNA-binding NarL/FixJ family response regulator